MGPTTLTLYRNRNTVFNIQFTRGGSNVDITNAVITLKLKRKYTDTTAIATLNNSSNGGITITDATTGMAVATFDTSDLSNVPLTPTTLYWELHILTATQDSWMADWGDAKVVVNVV